MISVWNSPTSTLHRCIRWCSLLRIWKTAIPSGAYVCPKGGLVMMIRRRGRYIVPDGKKRLLPGDALLIIKEEKDRTDGIR